MIDLHHVHSLTDFLRNHKEHIKRLRSIENPEVLTVNGKASLVVQGITGYQALLDRLEYAERLAGLRRGAAVAGGPSPEAPPASEELSRG